MAISKTVNFKGIAVPNAYIRVWRVECEKSSMTFGVGFHAEKDAEMFDSATVPAPYDISGPNPISQAYAHLKTLPEFEGSVDC